MIKPVSNLKRSALLFLLLLLAISFLLTIAPYPSRATTANAKTTTSSYVDFQMDRVDHVIQIRDGGSVIINDTITLSTRGKDPVQLQNFTLGFPFKYGFNLDYCFVYTTSNPDERLDVTFDVGLGRIGYYGVNVMFPKPVNISDDESYTFTAVFVFSNLISLKIESYPDPENPDVNITLTSSDLDFPIYPSLTQGASTCNVTVFLPDEFYYDKSSHAFNGTEGQILNHLKSPLEGFALEPAQLTFYSVEPLVIIDASEIKRHVSLNEWGRIFVSDFYHLINKEVEDLSEVKLRLPQGAYNVRAWDESGDLSLRSEKGTAYTNATITLRTALKKYEAAKFTLDYRLPWENYVSQPNWRNFNLAFTFFEHFNWTIRKLAVTITLPEGASFQFSEPANSQSIKKSGIQETITFNFSNVTPFHDLDFVLTYEYVIFWASFYPTLWVGLLVTAVCVIAFLWRAAPKPPSVPVIPVSPKALRSFVDTYERKTSAIGELEMLEQQVRKRKISRRLYKVRKKALEGRLSVLSKDLTDLKEELRKAGSRYANMIRQIEVAETELEETTAAIRRIELRYRRREISKGTYSKLLEEYNRRKERAETTIDGVLLRLREEIR